MIFLGLEVGSWADWLAAVGTILAVIIALRGRTDKAKLKINAEFIYSEYYLEIPDHFEVNNFGEKVPVFSGKYTDTLGGAEYSLIVYISNIRQSSGLITSWGMIGLDGKKCYFPEGPIMIKGFGVEKISRNESIDGDTERNYTIKKILDNKNISGKFKLFFEEVNGKTHYCNVKERKISNKEN
ncbi:hypothetical protein EFA59_02640 [Weissella hellenica]|nr:hypothetical protein EFA59_02640 [Weissella hellenica]